MDNTTSNRNVIPSADDVFNSIDMAEDSSYVNFDYNDSLFSPSPQTNTDVDVAVNESTLNTPNDPSQLENCFLPQCSKVTRNSDQLESVINETIFEQKEFAPLVNYQEFYSNDATYAPSPVSSTFPDSQSTNARSNELTLSKYVEQNQVLQQPSQTVSSEGIINDISTPPNEESTTFKNNSGGIIEDKMPLNIFQQCDFDHQSLRNLANRKNNAATDRSHCSMGSQINGDTLVLVPLSIVRKIMKASNFQVLAHKTNKESKVQHHSYPHPSIQGNLSNNAIEATEDVQDHLHQTTEGDGSSTSSYTNLTQSQQKHDRMKNNVRKLTDSGAFQQHERGTIKPNPNQRRKLKMLKSIRSYADVKAPLSKRQKRKLKCSEAPKKPHNLCKVCGDEESVHVHYGGKSCKSCRQFFRRTIERSSRQAGFCYPCKCIEGCLQKGKAICVVNKLTRNHCRYCRFKRCQTLSGMSMQPVLRALIHKVERSPIKKNS